MYRKPAGEVALVRCRDVPEDTPSSGGKRDARPVCPRHVEACVVAVRSEDGDWWLRRFRVSTADLEDHLARVLLVELVPGVGQVVVADPASAAGWRWLAGVGGISVVCFVRREDASIWYDSGLLVARFEPGRAYSPHQAEGRVEHLGQPSAPKVSVAAR